MQRILVSVLLLSVTVCAQAQTTVNITMPNSTTCTYTTGPVTSNSAVPGQLQATASGSTGTGCGGGSGSGGVSFGPASPLLPASTTLGNTGGPASLSFEAVNAAQCTGTISGASSGIFTGGTNTKTLCNSLAACTGVQNVSTTFGANATQADITNTVTVSCTGTGGGSPATSSASVIVHFGTVAGNCPAITGATGSAVASFTQADSAHKVTTTYFGSGGGTRPVDTTVFDNIWGVWPGLYGQNLYFSLPISNYISAKFTVPPTFFTAAGVPTPTVIGDYSIQQSDYSVPISMTISTTCGDFSSPGGNSTVVAGCRLNKGTSSNPVIQWRSSGTCQLTAGNSYYLNIINADISNVTPGGGTATTTETTAKCPGGACLDPLLNGIGNWGTWNGTNYIP